MEQINISVKVKAKINWSLDNYSLENVQKQILEFITISLLKGSVQGKNVFPCGPPKVGVTRATLVFPTLGRPKRQFFLEHCL